MTKLILAILVLSSCEQHKPTSVFAPSGAKIIHNSTGAGPTVCEITIEGHTYLFPSQGGGIHAEHCKCKTTKEPK